MERSEYERGTIKGLIGADVKKVGNIPYLKYLPRVERCGTQRMRVKKKWPAGAADE